MPTWSPSTVAEEPETTLCRWSAFEVQVPGFDSSTIHIAGETVESRLGRVTSPIVKIYPSRLSVVSQSGRIYRLQDMPEMGICGSMIWDQWVRLWKVRVLSTASPVLVAIFETGGEVVDMRRLH